MRFPYHAESATAPARRELLFRSTESSGPPPCERGGGPTLSFSCRGNEASQRQTPSTQSSPGSQSAALEQSLVASFVVAQTMSRQKVSATS